MNLELKTLFDLILECLKFAIPLNIVFIIVDKLQDIFFSMFSGKRVDL